LGDGRRVILKRRSSRGSSVTIGIKLKEKKTGRRWGPLVAFNDQKMGADHPRGGLKTSGGLVRKEVEGRPGSLQTSLTGNKAG